ncbi:Endocytosis and vacuole integrity protein, partial [Coemansia furcata]
STAEGHHSSLMRSVFPCLQLICTDYLADLSPGCLRRCIKALLVQFGRQEDLNIALTAVGQAWALCDYFHAMPCAEEPRGSGDLISAQLETLGEEIVFAALWQEELVAGTRRAQQVLWLLLLQALAQLGRDARAEVRLGGMQTLFRAVDMHGPSSFDRWVWDGAVWAVIHPLAQYTLTQRTRVFDTPHETPPPPEPSSTASGMVAEDPQRLLRKQWDDTVAAALLGAAKAWAYDGVWLIGGADRAWARVWLMTSELLAAEWRLRTRDAVAGALAAMRALVALAGGSPGAWRTAWDAWVAMARGATQLPADAAAEINIDDDSDDPVVTQDVLCALLEPSPALIAGLGPGFDARDCDALLGVVRHAVAFVDAPIYASDTAAMTRLQGLALDVVAGALDNDSDAVAANVVGELAVLAALPHALRLRRGECVALGDAAVVGASGLAYLDGHIERLDVLEGHKKEGTHRRRYAHPVSPTFAALGRAAGGRLGAALCDRPGLAQRVLESGAWLSAVAALGLDLIHSDDPWFVRTVPPAMNTLPPGPALDAAWMAIGSVVSLALRTKEVRSREGLLDAMSECSVKMASSCPREYWDVLLDTIEASVEDNEGALAVASLGWLERLSSIECPLVPEWVAASAAQRLVRRTKTIVDTFVADRTLFGSKSPLPLQRTHLLRRVLQGLALLQTRPMEGKGEEGRASHIVAVFPCLIGLVAESMGDFETARALQMCLRRVANEVLLISG